MARIGLIVAMLVLSGQAEVRRGSLAVYMLSKSSDYVVIRTESHTTNIIFGEGTHNDNRSCKTISLVGDTLFFTTGSVEISTEKNGKPWDSKVVARAVYKASQKRDAVSLSLAWGQRALKWFHTLPPHDLSAVAYGPSGMFVNGGFINFDKTGKLFIQSVDISFSASTRTLSLQPTTQSPGQDGIAGIGTELAADSSMEKRIKLLEPLGLMARSG